jgi:hypothetical protein
VSWAQKQVHQQTKQIHMCGGLKAPLTLLLCEAQETWWRGHTAGRRASHSTHSALKNPRLSPSVLTFLTQSMPDPAFQLIIRQKSRAASWDSPTIQTSTQSGTASSLLQWGPLTGLLAKPLAQSSPDAKLCPLLSLLTQPTPNF